MIERHLFLLEVVIQKDCLSCFICVLKVSLRLTLIQKGFVSFKFTASNGRFLSVYALGISPENSCFFEGLQNHMENKNQGNENKIILGEFNCAMDEMERDGRNKTLYKCHFNDLLSKIIGDIGLEHLWRRKNPDSSEFTHCNRSFGTRYTIGSHNSIFYWPL